MRLRVFGLPLHPFLVHFPIAFWLVLPFLDLACLVVRPEPWWTLALAAATTGSIIGGAAIVAGLMEYREPSLAGIDLRLAASHGVRTSLAWLVFTIRMAAALVLPPTDRTILSCLVLDVVGCALLLQGIYLGTRQVYEPLERD